MRPLRCCCESECDERLFAKSCERRFVRRCNPVIIACDDRRLIGRKLDNIASEPRDECFKERALRTSRAVECINHSTGARERNGLGAWRGLSNAHRSKTQQCNGIAHTELRKIFTRQSRIRDKHSNRAFRSLGAIDRK